MKDDRFFDRFREPKYPKSNFSRKEGRCTYSLMLDSGDGHGIQGQLVIANLDWVADRQTIRRLAPDMIVNCCGSRCCEQNVIQQYQHNYTIEGIHCVNFSPSESVDVESVQDATCPLKIMWHRLTTEKGFFGHSALLQRHQPQRCCHCADPVVVHGHATANDFQEAATAQIRGESVWDAWVGFYSSKHSTRAVCRGREGAPLDRGPIDAVAASSKNTL